MTSGKALAFAATALVMAVLSFLVYNFLLWTFFREGGFRVYGGWFSWHAFLDGLFFAWPFWWALVLVAKQLSLGMSLLYGALLASAGVALNYFVFQQQSPEGVTIWLSSYRGTVLAVLLWGMIIAWVVSRGIVRSAAGRAA